MRAAAARHPGDVLVEQMDRAGVRRDLAGDLVEQGGLAGAVWADDQTPLTRRDDEIDVGGDAQPAERLAERVDGERGHPCAPVLGAGACAGGLPRSRVHKARLSRTAPGTRPSGMKMTMATKMAPSTRFQRTM